MAWVDEQCEALEITRAEYLRDALDRLSKMSGKPAEALA
jgi:hypothetical protein